MVFWCTLPQAWQKYNVKPYVFTKYYNAPALLPSPWGQPGPQDQGHKHCFPWLKLCILTSDFPFWPLNPSKFVKLASIFLKTLRFQWPLFRENPDRKVVPTDVMSKCLTQAKYKLNMDTIPYTDQTIQARSKFVDKQMNTKTNKIMDG